MKPVSRDELKIFFKKVKHLRLPQNLEELDFSYLHYLGWKDESDDVVYIVTNDKNALRGAICEVTKMPNRPMMKGLCSICKQQREFNEIMMITAKTKRLPKGVEYYVKGVYICEDFDQCNADIKNSAYIQQFLDSLYNIS